MTVSCNRYKNCRQSFANHTSPYGTGIYLILTDVIRNTFLTEVRTPHPSHSVNLTKSSEKALTHTLANSHAILLAHTRFTFTLEKKRLQIVEVHRNTRRILDPNLPNFGLSHYLKKRGKGEGGELRSQLLTSPYMVTKIDLETGPDVRLATKSLQAKTFCSKSKTVKG